jgi:hypothetical protein
MRRLPQGEITASAPEGNPADSRGYSARQKASLLALFMAIDRARRDFAATVGLIALGLVVKVALAA